MPKSALPRVPRSLEDGWNFDPAWRRLVVGEYLRAAAELVAQDAEDPLVVLEGEPDAYVREYFRFRFSGESRLAPAFTYAERAEADTTSPRAGTLIRAMTIAGLTPVEVAAELGTSVKAVKAFLKVFFDIERYSKNRSWLHRVVFGRPSGRDERAVEDGELMAVAFTHGRAGLAQALHGVCALDDSGRAALQQQLETMLLQRAHSFVAVLQARGIRPSDVDFQRYVRLAEAAELRSSDSRQSREEAFRDGLIAALHAKALREPENEHLQETMKNLPAPAAEPAAAEP